MTWTIEERVLEALREMSDETMIPQARIVEKALKQILDKEIDKALSNLPMKKGKIHE